MYKGNWEKRWHPLRREWIVYAAHRNSRPWNFAAKPVVTHAHSYDPGCYLCPGNARVSGQINPDYKNVFIFENDHPVVGMDAPEPPANEKSFHGSLYRKGKAAGIAKVVCYDPRHNVTLSDVMPEQVTKVFVALREEMKTFEKNETIKSVLIFENKGEIVGVSNPHPHCQIYATDFVFNLFSKELA
ncbi:MAG TPA: galactose-1-phosphate uridylyltransferase, partial [Flavitalea sp.]|nr:galactose-1-phosphate uridylyltransferase [Flavitalea sp.]